MEATLPMIPAPRTLIADDHPDVLAALRMLLRNEGWQTEAANDAGEFFGEERLLRLLVEQRRQSAAELSETILAAVADFSGGSFQDDVTLMALAVED